MHRATVLWSPVVYYVCVLYSSMRMCRRSVVDVLEGGLLNGRTQPSFPTAYFQAVRLLENKPTIMLGSIGARCFLLVDQPR